MDFERDLQPRFPRLIHCTVFGFGPDGPFGGLPSYDAAIQAMVGLISANGERDGGLMRVGLPIVDMMTGLNVLAGILFALAERGKSGRGQSIDIVLYDHGVSLLHPHPPNYSGSGKVPQRSGNAHPNIAPYDSYQTGTASILLAVDNDCQLARLCVHVSAAGLTQGVRFVDNRSRCAYHAELKVALGAQLARFDCETLAQDLIHSSVPCGPVLSVDMVARHSYTPHWQMVVELGEYHGTGLLIKPPRTSVTYRSAPPALGVDTDAMLASFGTDADTRRRLFQVGILK